MHIITMFIIGLGLAVDSFAVSVANGLAVKKLGLFDVLKASVFFGVMHAIMLIGGWFAGTNLEKYITEVDHWIAFGLLVFVGIKMIYEAFCGEIGQKIAHVFDSKTLLLLAFATSIDALAVGIGFAFLDISITLPVIIISSMTFIFTGLGFLIGNKVGHFFERKLEIIGGLVLIGIGAKILIEHLW